MNKYIEYTKAFSQENEKVIQWLNSTCKNYLKTNPEVQDDIEHIIDYLTSEDAPNNIAGMSYEEAKKNTDKWNKSQIKKGKDITETESDTEVVLDFKDGFKIVKLVGENAYKREGFLMSHCVGGYYGNGKEVYSLRDNKNMPHCTMEKDQQIKGKGNGDIHPKYVDYVVKFLEYTGMTVGDNEMKHLGYVNIEKLLPELHEDVNKLLYANKYYPQNKGYENLKDKDGNQYLDMDILDYFPFFKEEETETSFKLKLNFDMSLIVDYFKKKIIKTKTIDTSNKDVVSAEDYAKVSAGNNATVSAGYNAKVSAEDYATVSAGYNAKVSAEDNATVSAGYNAKVSAGNNAKVSAEDNAKVSAEDYATVSAGNNAKVSAEDNATVSAGYNAKVSAEDYATVSAEDNATVSAGYNAKVSAEDYAKVLAGYNAKISAGNYAKISAGNESEVSSGKHSILVADHKGKAKGKIGTIILLTTRKNKDGEWIITEWQAVMVDGKKIKEDVWYELKGNKIVKVI